MQRKIGTGVELGATVSPFDSIEAFSALDRSASNYLNTGEKVQRIRKLKSTGTYLSGIAKFIPGTLDLVYQGNRHKGITCIHIVQRNGKFRLLNNVNQ